jgi:hypothetical protein
MGTEIVFNIEKPVTEKELQDFRLFKKEIKLLLKKGKLRVVEKFKDFAFVIINCSTDEKNNISTFLKKEHQTIRIIS